MWNKIRTKERVVSVEGVEPSTHRLKVYCSSTELHAHRKEGEGLGGATPTP